jgi:electron transport complex protein RnfB
MTFNASLAEKIELLLPQTQCRQCGYPGCKPYAEAISRDEADINQCPPGGEQGIKQLSQLLNIPAKPLNSQFGVEKPFQVAVIIEADCIGCTRCLPPCPVLAVSYVLSTVRLIASLCKRQSSQNLMPFKPENNTK